MDEMKEIRGEPRRQAKANSKTVINPVRCDKHGKIMKVFWAGGLRREVRGLKRLN